LRLERGFGSNETEKFRRLPPELFSTLAFDS